MLEIIVYFFKLLTDLPEAVTLDYLADAVSTDQIRLTWSRVDRASTYRVYRRIKNEDGEWNERERVNSATDVNEGYV